MGLDPKSAEALGIRHQVDVRPDLRAAFEQAGQRGRTGRRRAAPTRAAGTAKRPQAGGGERSAAQAPQAQITPWPWSVAELEQAQAFRAKGQAEDAEQYLLASALDAAGLLWAHPPNGGGRSAREGAEFQALGVKPGVPDILVFARPVTRPWVAGAAIELKAPERRTKSNPTSGTSAAQRDWLSALALEGWATTVAYSAAEALSWLTAVGYRLEAP